jgi:hypothetical protein
MIRKHLIPNYIKYQINPPSRNSIIPYKNSNKYYEFKYRLQDDGRYKLDKRTVPKILRKYIRYRLTRDFIWLN